MIYLHIMSKILILGVAPAQADAICYLKKAGHETFAVAMPESGSGVELADHFALINILDEKAVITYKRKQN